MNRIHPGAEPLPAVGEEVPPDTHMPAAEFEAKADGLVKIAEDAAAAGGRPTSSTPCSARGC